jgi:predicted nucleic acid-binding protein
MTPKEKAKEKAKELVRHFWDLGLDIVKSKKCALIAVDKILDIYSVDKDYELSNYWEEVKQEIEKL